MTRTFDPIDEAIDLHIQWARVLAIVRSTVFTDNERVAFVFYFLGYSTDEIARLITKPDGTPITRERGRQLVRAGLTKIFATLNAGEPPALTVFFSYGCRRQEPGKGAQDDATP